MRAVGLSEQQTSPFLCPDQFTKFFPNLMTFHKKKSDWERESGKGKQYIGKSAYQNKVGSWKKEENLPNAKMKKGKNISKN